MKHLIRVSIFLEVDTDHPDFHGPTDPDLILGHAREAFSDFSEFEASDGMAYMHHQVELVE